MGKTFSALTAFLLVCALILSFTTKESFKSEPAVSDYNDYSLKFVHYESDETEELESDDDSIKAGSAAQKLLEEAESVQTPLEAEIGLLEKIDFIAKVRFTGKRTQQYMSSLSTVDVLEVYKGDASLVGKQVDVFETNYFEPTGYYCNMCCVNLMKDGGIYYVLLKSTQYMPEYQAKLERLRFSDYLACCSVIPVEITLETPITNTSALTYGKIKDYDYIFFSKKDAQMVREVREGVMEYVGID